MDILTLSKMLNRLESKYGWMMQAPYTPEYVTEDYCKGYADALEIVREEFLNACKSEEDMERGEVTNFHPIELTEDMIVNEVKVLKTREK